VKRLRTSLRAALVALVASPALIHAGVILVAGGRGGSSSAPAAVVPQWMSSPVLSGAQTTLHALQVGIPFSLDLKTFMSTPGTSFTIVSTSRAYNQSVLPAGIGLSSDGVLSGTPSEAATVVIRVRAHLGSRNAMASWNARKALALNSDGFESSTSIDLGVATGFVSRSTYDTGKSRSGPGSLKQVDGTGVNNEAKWEFSAHEVQNMNGVSGGGFASNVGYAPGETMYCAFTMFTDRNFVQYPWPTTGLSDSSTALKIVRADSSYYAPNLNQGRTNEWEIVMTNRHGGPWGYTNGPEGVAWNFDVGGRPNADHTNAQGHTVFQPFIQDTSRSLNGVNPGLASGGTTGGAWTSSQQERARNGFVGKIGGSNEYEDGVWSDGVPDPLTAGSIFPIDDWITIKFAIKLAQEPIANDGNGYPFLSSGGWFKAWAAQDGQDYQLLYSNDPHWLRVDNDFSPTSPNWFQKASTPNNSPSGSMSTAYWALSFTTLAFNMNMPASPAYQQWFDEIQCGTQDVPAPDFDGTGNYRTSDVLVTLKVSP
jgi:hypothetical protein